MDYIKEFINGALFTRICLWGMFLAGLTFTIWGGISPIGVIATIGVLLMAIDFPRKEKRNR